MNNRELVNAGVRFSPAELRRAAALVRATTGAVKYYRGVNQVVKFAKGLKRKYWDSSNKPKKKKTGGNENYQYVESQRTGGKMIRSTRRKVVRTKKSLKKRVKALEKAKMPNSTYEHIYEYPWRIECPKNAHRVHQIKVTSTALMETVMAAVEFPSGNIDLTAKNTAVKVGAYTNIRLVNAGLHKVKIRYCVVECNDNTDSTPLGAARDHLIDRGVTAGTVQAEQIPTTSRSRLPGYWDLTTNLRMIKPIQFLTEQSSGKYKKITKVEYVTLNPGDETTFKVVFPMKVWKPEIKDQANEPNIKGWDQYVIIDTYGEIGHSDTSDQLVGICPVKLDAVMNHKITVVAQNGLGLHNLTYTTDSDYSLASTHNFVQAGTDNIVE